MENLKGKLNALCEAKLLKKTEIESYLQKIKSSGLSLEDYFMNNQIISEEKLYQALAEFYEMPFSHLDMLEVSSELVEKFGINYLRKHQIVPIKINEKGTLIIATSKPFDFFTLSSISFLHQGDISFILVTPSELWAYLNSIFAVKNTANALQDLNTKNGKKEEKSEENDLNENQTQEDVQEEEINAPAVRLVDSIIKEAIPFRASDIHIEPYEKKVCVRYRIDGDLSTKIEFEKSNYPAVVARIKIISGMNIAERRKPQDGRINMEVNGVEYDFRISTLPTVYGEKFVIRVLDKSSFSLTRKELGFRKEANEIIDKILSHPHGLVLLTGPTGCGKSTSLYCFLKEVNKTDVNIVTVEDPVEYSMQGINQIQVNPKADLTFATALRSILRQDPDIIMVGEIRDEETAQMAVRAAITGHLVFSTLHTNDSTGAVARLTDMGANTYLVADALVGVISQRLIKKLCPICKTKHKTTKAENEMLGLESSVEIFEPKGCKACGYSGFKGRMAVNEIMYVNEKIRNEINKGSSAEKLREVAKENGLIELNESCRMCVIEGDTSISEFININVSE